MTLSSAARQQQASQSPTATKPRAGDIASEDAHADPVVAEQFAHEAAFIEDQVVVDITDWMSGKGPPIVKATGEPYTPEYEAKFKARATAIRDQRIALYESEKAKGTPAADIFDKLQDFFDALPKDYQDLVRSKGD